MTQRYTHPSDDHLRAILERNLTAFDRLSIDDASLGKAAVVVAVSADSDDSLSASFLLTRRASKLRNHAGQFALPGGKIDPGETIKDAALRELHEELGIDVKPHNILGLLDDYPTRSGFCITPVVVWLNHVSQLSPNPDEVARVFRIPLRDLERDNLINLDPGESPDRPVFSVNLNTVGYEVYAPTAAIIYQFFKVAVKGVDTRVAFYDEPRFAWR